MAYTAADLTAVDTAIRKIIDGERVVQVKDGEQTVTYSDVDIDKLHALRARMQSEIAASAGRRRTTVVRTSKGL